MDSLKNILLGVNKPEEARGLAKRQASSDSEEIEASCSYDLTGGNRRKRAKSPPRKKNTQNRSQTQNPFSYNQAPPGARGNAMDAKLDSIMKSLTKVSTKDDLRHINKRLDGVEGEQKKIARNQRDLIQRVSKLERKKKRNLQGRARLSLRAH